MKVALCVSGHARTYAFTHQFWHRHLISKFQTDVFMHLWDTIGPRSFGEGRSEHSPLPREDFDSGILQSSTLDINHIAKLWNPTSIVVEKYDTMHNALTQQVTPIIYERDRRGIPAGFEHHHPLSVRSMLYKRFQCNRLKIDYERMYNMKYDLVIQTRTDVAITGDISSEILEDSNKLYFHNCRSVTPDPEINDFGAIGASEKIDLWCNLFNQQFRVFERIRGDDNFFKFLNPHKMYVQYLMEENQEYKEMDINLSIVRDSGIILGWDHAKKTIQEVM